MYVKLCVESAGGVAPNIAWGRESRFSRGDLSFVLKEGQEPNKFLGEIQPTQELSFISRATTVTSVC